MFIDLNQIQICDPCIVFCIFLFFFFFFGNRSCGPCSTSVVLSCWVTRNGNNIHLAAVVLSYACASCDTKNWSFPGLRKNLSMPFFVEMKKRLLIGKSVLVQQLQR